MSELTILGIFVADISFSGDKIPITGETILGDSYNIGPGGKGCNQAIAISRLGGKVNFISKLGKDNYGKLAIDKLKKDNIDTSNIIKRSKIFLTQLEIPLDVTFHCLKLAKENGLINILNPAPACELNNDFFKLVDYFTPNETEAEFYTGIKINDERDAKNSAEKLLSMGIKKVIITLGEKGLFYSDGNEDIFIRASSVKTIDTTGAGDAFNGGFSFALLKGKKIKECLELANKVAGLSTTKLGAGDSMPFLKDLN